MAPPPPPHDHDHDPELTPELLLRAYAMGGIFPPMADGRDDPRVFWVDPEMRGVLPPLDGFRLSRSLRKRIRQEPYRLSLNTDFAGVVQGCADRDETWINDTIFGLYRQLYRMGFAHSFEVWDGAELVGGTYGGVSLGRAFFGESMFSRRRDASKIALAYAVTHLSTCGYTLFDTQFLTDHLASLGGGVEIPRAQYHDLLERALQAPPADINARPLPDAHSVVQFNTHTS